MANVLGAVKSIKNVSKAIKSSVIDDLTKTSTTLLKQNADEAASIATKSRTEYLVEAGRRQSAKEAQLAKEWTKVENQAVDALAEEKNRVIQEVQTQNLDRLSIQAEKSSIPDATPTIVSEHTIVPKDQQIQSRIYQAPATINTNPNNTAPAIDIWQDIEGGKAGYSGLPEPINNGKNIATDNAPRGSLKVTLTPEEEEALAAGTQSATDIMAAAQRRAEVSTIGITKSEQNIADLMIEANNSSTLSGTKTEVFTPGKAKRGTGSITTTEAIRQQKEAQKMVGSTMRAVLGTAVVGAGICAALSSNRGQQNNAQLYGQQPLY